MSQQGLSVPPWLGHLETQSPWSHTQGTMHPDSTPCVRAGWLAWAGSSAGTFMLLADPQLQVTETRGSWQDTSFKDTS